MRALRLLLPVAVVAAAVLAATQVAAAGSVTIGQTGSSVGCGPNAVWWQGSGGSYTVPAGSWTVTSWSIDGGIGGQVAAVVLEPSGGGYTVVGVSATETLTAGTLNTFTTSLPASGGDVIGLSSAGGFQCAASGGAGDTVSWGCCPPASVGANLSSIGTAPASLLNLSATLVASPGTAVPQVSSLFVCYSKFEQDGGAVYTAAQAESLLAEGEWSPVAIAGTVPGGDDVGGYHLACNPPVSLAPTGRYVGDGGDVVSVASPGYYAIVG